MDGVREFTVSRKVCDLTLVSGIRANAINKISVQKACVRRYDTFFCAFYIPMNSYYIWISLDNIESISICWLTTFTLWMTSWCLAGRKSCLLSLSYCVTGLLFLVLACYWIPDFTGSSLAWYFDMGFCEAVVQYCKALKMQWSKWSMLISLRLLSTLEQQSYSAFRCLSKHVWCWNQQK